MVKKNLLIGLALLLVLVVAGIYQAYTLQIAHSTFDNYYKFRGCVGLVEKTDTYGICKLSSGQTIKLVEANNRWYLDGDLPYQGFNFL
jgi:hypothetical protein